MFKSSSGGPERFSTLRFLLAVLLSLVTLNGLIVIFEDELSLYRKPDRLAWRSKINSLEQLELERIKLLILGDSLAMSGVWPARFERPPGEVINLALPSQQPEGVLTLVRTVLARGGRPKMVINVSPFMFYNTTINDTFRYYYRGELLPLLPGSWFSGPGLLARNPAEWVMGAFHLIPLFRWHDFITGATAIRLPGTTIHNPPTAGDTKSYLARGYNVLDGWRLNYRNNQFLSQNLVDEEGFWTWEHFEKPQISGCRGWPDLGQNPLQKLPLRERRGVKRVWLKLLTELLANDIEVYLIELPNFPGMASQELPFRLSELLARESTLPPGKLSRLTPLGTPPEWSSFKSEYFQDFVHLSSCGARLYTDWLKERITF